MLETQAVNLVYTAGGMETYAVRDVSLRIGAGEFVGIMGPSGSGKSSLLYLLCGLKQPTRGGVFYRGADIARMPAGERADLRRRRFGFIFQQHFLINYLTVLENVLVGCPKVGPAERRLGMDLLESVNLAGQARKYPPELSGGQRQRVAAVRAIATRPEVLFADEPTASLDHKTGLDLMQHLTAYQRQGGTLIAVTHDPTILADATRVVQVWDGEIVAGQWPETPVPGG